MVNNKAAPYPVVNTSRTANAAPPCRHRALTELRHYMQWLIYNNKATPYPVVNMH